MLFIDSIEQNKNECLVRGWLFDAHKELLSCHYEDGRKQIDLTGHGLPSPDLISDFGEQASHCRFELFINKSNPKGFIVFEFNCGACEVVSLSTSTEIADSIQVKTHQIVNNRYYGKFILSDELDVKHAILSVRTPYDKCAIPIKKKKGLRFNSELRTLFLETPIDPLYHPDDLNIYLVMKDKSILSLIGIGIRARKDIPVFWIQEKFFEWLGSKAEPISIIEIGSRARSGIIRRNRIPTRHKYTGIDIMEGENVDIVGDAHALSQLIEPNSADAVFAFSVFEHLAMPWKVAIELNRIMRIGARAMFLTHQVWPLHDAPFDFWRFSKESWYTLFNQSTGFKILETEVGDKAQVFAELQSNENHFPCDNYGYLASSVLIEKTGNTELSWDVAPEDIYQGEYPE